MTVGSRRLAARCRERFATDPITPSATPGTTHAEPRTTLDDTADVESAIPQENLDATAT